MMQRRNLSDISACVLASRHAEFLRLAEQKQRRVSQNTNVHEIPSSIEQGQGCRQRGNRSTRI